MRRSGVTIALVAMLEGVAFAAEPPQLFDVVVDPVTLMLGVGEQRVTITVTVIDDDGDLDPESVNLKKIRIGNITSSPSPSRPRSTRD